MRGKYKIESWSLLTSSYAVVSIAIKAMLQINFMLWMRRIKNCCNSKYQFSWFIFCFFDLWANFELTLQSHCSQHKTSYPSLSRTLSQSSGLQLLLLSVVTLSSGEPQIRRFTSPEAEKWETEWGNLSILWPASCDTWYAARFIIFLLSCVHLQEARMKAKFGERGKGQAAVWAR